MNRELDQTLQRNLERLYNYLENPEREEAQRVLLAAEPEPIRITHGILTSIPTGCHPPATQHKVG